jgi:hypothetical protein
MAAHDDEFGDSLDGVRAAFGLTSIAAASVDLETGDSWEAFTATRAQQTQPTMDDPVVDLEAPRDETQIPTFKELGLTLGHCSQLDCLGIRAIENLDGAHIPALLQKGIPWLAMVKILPVLRQRQIPFSFSKPAWGEDHWRDMVQNLVSQGLISWRQVGAHILGGINPCQVGTALASNKNMQNRYGKGGTLHQVITWLYRQSGTCTHCGSRLALEVDHIKSKEEHVEEGLDIAEADRLDNFRLLCKRCNVIRRKSHKLGGLSFETAGAALMWILLVLRPKTRAEYVQLCREHGLTMSSVRFDEAWAMAIWLARQGQYTLLDSQTTYTEEGDGDEVEDDEAAQ